MHQSYDDLICEHEKHFNLGLKMSSDELRQLQGVTSLMASFLGHTECLFGMELAGEVWSDSSEYSYFPKKKRLEDFTKQDCIDTLYHVHEWLSENNKNTQIYWNENGQEEKS